MFDIKGKASSRLEMFKVRSDLYSPKNDSTQAIKVGRPLGNMAFTILGKSIDMVCLLDKIEDADGNFRGDSFFPITQSLQKALRDSLTPICFHFAVDKTGAQYLMPQKKARLNGGTSSWVESMEGVIDAAREGWVTLRSDHRNKCYTASHVTNNIPMPQDIPDIEDELYKALKDNTITNPDHPILD